MRIMHGYHSWFNVLLITLPHGHMKRVLYNIFNHSRIACIEDKLHSDNYGETKRIAIAICNWERRLRSIT